MEKQQPIGLPLPDTDTAMLGVVNYRSQQRCMDRRQKQRPPHRKRNPLHGRQNLPRKFAAVTFRPRQNGSRRSNAARGQWAGLSLCLWHMQLLTSS